MSSNAEHNVPTITGTRGELFSWELTIDDPNYTTLNVSLELSQTLPSVRQSVSTATYSLPDLHPLQALLDGDANAKFAFATIHFQCEIYEHTWGTRYGLITAGTISTISDQNFAPWPKPRELGNYLLDHHSTAACLHFAFRCDYESLRLFYDQLALTIARLRMCTDDD